MEKQCTKCKAVKPVDMFHRCMKSKGGYHSNCKECRKKVKKLSRAFERLQETDQVLGDFDILCAWMYFQTDYDDSIELPMDLLEYIQAESTLGFGKNAVDNMSNPQPNPTLSL